MYSLALWWGAARWFIHLGVLKYLEEKNIKITEVSGTSMGAIIASFVAIWKNADYMINFAKKINYFSLVDFDFKMWLLKWEKIEKMFRKEFWDINIEDCKIPLKIVATNIEDWLIHIFTKWNLVDAMRASFSLPGVFVPKEIDGISYVDGGIMMNLPVQALNWEKIIASSALKVEKWDIQTSSKFLWMNFKSGFLKNNFKILSRSLNLLMKANEDISLISVWKELHFLRPTFWDLDMLDFEKIDEFVEIWYNEAKNRLGDL